MVHCDIRSMNGERALYRLIDRVVSPELQSHYSWAGKKDQPQKKSFKRFQKTIKFVFEICQKADPNYGYAAFEKRMKNNVLPHAARRNKNDDEIMRESAPKIRKTRALPKSKRCKMDDVPMNDNDAANQYSNEEDEELVENEDNKPMPATDNSSSATVNTTDAATKSLPEFYTSFTPGTHLHLSSPLNIPNDSVEEQLIEERILINVDGMPEQLVNNDEFLKFLNSGQIQNVAAECQIDSDKNNNVFTSIDTGNVHQSTDSTVAETRGNEQSDDDGETKDSDTEAVDGMHAAQKLNDLSVSFLPCACTFLRAN